MITATLTDIGIACRTLMAATIAVPAIVGNGLTAAAAMFGAGVGTLVYLLLTKFKSHFLF